jgi:hypothetical protein
LDGKGDAEIRDCVNTLSASMLYSVLRAIAGSTRVARTAGIPHAGIATTTSVVTARSEEMSNDVPTP